MWREAVRFRAAGRELYGEVLLPPQAGDLSGREVLVFLHEGLGSVGQWRDFPAVLSSRTGLPALVYDRWGYGRSEFCPAPRPITYLHDEALLSLPEVLDRFSISRPVFIGHSDGGSIALIFAGSFPERAAGVVTEAAHVFVEEVTLEGIRKAVAAFATTDLRSRLARYHPDKVDAVFRGWSETWLDPAFRSWNIESFLGGIRCPVLAVQGTGDPYGTPGQVEAIVRGCGGRARGLMVEDCGHIPHHEAREAVTAAVGDFIASLRDP